MVKKNDSRLPPTKVTTSPTLFSVKSKPYTKSSTLSWIDKICNFLSSAFILHVLIQQIFFKHVVRMYCIDQGFDLGSNDDYITMWEMISLPLVSWEVKAVIIIYNLMILIQIGFLIHHIMKVMNITSSSTTTQNVCHVEILPWGIQIDESAKIIQIGASKAFENRVTRTINKRSTFIPLENVIDVIVSEVILSYKVRSCVIFRIKSSSDQCIDKEEECKDNNVKWEGITLIPAFSVDMIEMSYIECIQMWKGISDALSIYR